MRANNLLSATMTTTLLLLAGCSTVENPASTYSLQRFAVPEVAAESWQVGIYAGSAETHKVVLPVHSAQKPNFSCNKSTKCKTEEPVLSTFGLSVAPGLAFQYNPVMRRGSAIWQYSGDFAGQAKAGNFSQALVLGYGLHKDHGAFGDASVVVDANTSLSWDQSTKSLDIGWVAGYRLNDDWLLYGGPFVVKHDIDMSSRFRQPGDYDDTINPKRKFYGNQLGANIAAQYEFFHRMSLNLELVTAKYRMDGVTQSDTQLNLMLGVHF